MNLGEHLSLGEFHISNLIKNHISKGSPRLSLVLYGGIRRKGVYFPGWVPLLLKACAFISSSVYGKLLHSESIKFGVCSDVMVGTSLINMYGKWGCVVSTRKVFDEMPERNVVTWNAMIGGYMGNGDAVSATGLFDEIRNCGNTVTWTEMMKGYGKRKKTEKARDLFERMPIELKNVKAWSVMLGAYVSNREMEAARAFFEEIQEKNSFVWSLMISGYFRIGDVDEAIAVFYRVLVRDLVIWNTLIAGLAKNGYSDDAIDAFYKMQGEGFEPDEVTVSSVLSACAQSCRLDVGREVHSLINSKGIELNQFVSNARIDTYAKCGDLENATSVFESLSLRNVACWNSMISCLAVHGKGREALDMFRTMERLDTKYESSKDATAWVKPHCQKDMLKKNNNSENQTIDSLPSPPSSSSSSGENRDYWLGIRADEFMEDDACINDENMETTTSRCGDDEEDFLLCSETQALDLGFETQEEPLVEELLGDYDGLNTQVLDRFDVDDEGTNVLEENSEFYDVDESLNRGGNLLPSEDNRRRDGEKIESEGVVDAKSNEHKISGKVASFASIRSAAFRASAVAARDATRKYINSECSTLLNFHSSGQGATHKSSLEYKQCPPSVPVEKKNDIPKRNRTARKLVFEDSTEEIFSVDSGCIVSQEPGEASQAIALDFVDKFIKESCLEYALDIDANCGRRPEEKSQFFPFLKGPQELAKKVSYKGRAVGNSTFDWDDSREDEGGGDIFRRRKEEFFGGASKARISSTFRREQKRESIHKSHKGLGVAVDNKQRAHSDTRLLLQQHSVTKSRKKNQAAIKNIGKDLDAVSEDSSAHGAEASCLTGKNLSQGEERGFSSGVITTRSKGTKRIQAMCKDELLKTRMKKTSPSPAKACGKNIERSAKSGKPSSREERDVCSYGAGTRKSKRLMGIQAVDNDDVESLKPKTKKARFTRSKACEMDIKIETPDVIVVSSTEKRGGESSNKHCISKQTSRGKAEVLSYPKQRRPARISQDLIIEAAFDTPVKSNTLSKNASPICFGDEYHRLSCKDLQKSKTTRDCRSLSSPLVKPLLETKSTRKIRDLSSICVLFSQHLDEDVTKHQRKILARFDISEASSMMEATHFVADNFMRTRNMLEAMALGKPVVTTQWLESIEKVNIYVDEDLYMLRDSEKEKDLGFSMRVSLAYAQQKPLLKGRRVFITPNTKPGLNTIATLVKAVHGQPVERLGRSALREDTVHENLLILSCEEDHDLSRPFLERGAEVYSSEILLNGIVTQKLEYERYRLFADHVRRTRSTIWIKDGKGKFQRGRV
ncbi:unnamed protein product [Cochlearia groenlandica]